MFTPRKRKDETARGRLDQGRSRRSVGDVRGSAVHRIFGRVRLRAGIWLCLILFRALPAHASDPIPIITPDETTNEPITLAADRIVAWTYGPVQWAVLTREVAVMQGTEGLRGYRAIARIVADPSAGKGVYRVDSYVESEIVERGFLRTQTRRTTNRSTLKSNGGYELKPYSIDGLTRLDNPIRLEDWMLKGFPELANQKPTKPTRNPAPIQPPDSSSKSPSAPQDRQAAQRGSGRSTGVVAPTNNALNTNTNISANQNASANAIQNTNTNATQNANATIYANANANQNAANQNANAIQNANANANQNTNANQNANTNAIQNSNMNLNQSADINPSANAISNANPNSIRNANADANQNRTANVNATPKTSANTDPVSGEAAAVNGLTSVNSSSGTTGSTGPAIPRTIEPEASSRDQSPIGDSPIAAVDPEVSRAQDVITGDDVPPDLLRPITNPIDPDNQGDAQGAGEPAAARSNSIPPAQSGDASSAPPLESPNDASGGGDQPDARLPRSDDAGSSVEADDEPAAGTRSQRDGARGGTRGGAGSLPAPIPEANLPDMLAKFGPILPGTQRIINIYPSTSNPNYRYQQLPPENGYTRVVIRGGVNIVVNTGTAQRNKEEEDKKEEEKKAEAKKKAKGITDSKDKDKKEGDAAKKKGESPPAQYGTIDIVSDNAVIWYKLDPEKKSTVTAEGGVKDDGGKPLEVYLEGNVVIRQDDRLIAGVPDQRTFRADRAYYNFQTDRMTALDTESNMFAPGLVAPLRVFSPKIDQYRPSTVDANGNVSFGTKIIHAEQTKSTGSRFANPGYSFNSRSMDIEEEVVPLQDPTTGKSFGDKKDPATKKRLKTYLNASQNVFFISGVPVFYWPFMKADEDDLNPPFRAINPGYVNYFGEYVLTDWNGFRVFGLKRPKEIDVWNLEVDALTARGLGLGTNLGYYGKNLLNAMPGEYFGYFKMWGLQDHGIDDLGTGPAIVTNGPAGAGKRGFQRGAVPPYQQYRGMITYRHMQSLLDDTADPLEDFRAQLEFGYISDRHFLEQYYQNEFNAGRDQNTDLYVIRQKNGWAATALIEGNLQNWYTQTQSLPRVDYFRLGDSLLGDRFTYFQHTGADYAAVNTAIEVNNPNIFAFMPYDPISNTSGLWQSGRIYTAHELDMPLKFQFFRVVPYVQGQFVGWNQQLAGQAMGRVWGAVGARLDAMAWKLYPNVENDLLNVHGINHKIEAYADFRDAWANQSLNSIGVQDTLDDNTYEFTRRYFALTNYAGGILPGQYDPRFLLLRRMISPITGTTDIQGTIEGLRTGIHQRLQTKRGPIGRRRIVDFMELDLTTTYFPNAARDNFGKSFGQNMYNWEWFVGDRTSIVSYGWFEFFNITGQPLLKTNPNHTNNPFGLNVITSGISIARPPRGQLFLGYTVIDTGPITTSALSFNYSYWMSPKWFSTFSTMYDFGNGVGLGSMLSVTRIGSDFLSTIGLSIDPQRGATQFGFQLVPRISPNISNGASQGLQGLDTRYAPTQ